MRQLPGRMRWLPGRGVAVCGDWASYPVCGVWLPASRGGQLPGELDMTAGGPRQPSLAQWGADVSDDQSLRTKRTDWLADVVAELLGWSLNVTDVTELELCFFYTQPDERSLGLQWLLWALIG
jgi:hypothetical protein